MTAVKLESCTMVPREEGEELGMPTFLVQGTLRGKPFKAKVSLELDGRDAEIEEAEGAFDPDDGDDAQEVYEAIGDTDAYKDAYREFEESYS